MKDREPLPEEEIEDYYDVIYRAQYGDEVRVRDPGRFLEWISRKMETSQEEFGMSPATFFLLALKILKDVGVPIYYFFDRIKSKRMLMLGIMELVKQDPKMVDKLLKKDINTLMVFKKLPKDLRKPFKETLSIIARTEIGEKQYLALEALSDFIEDDPELKEFFYSLLNDWDERVRYIVLKTLAKNPDEETKKHVRSIKYEESNENNLKLIDYILSEDG